MTTRRSDVSTGPTSHRRSWAEAASWRTWAANVIDIAYHAFLPAVTGGPQAECPSVSLTVEALAVCDALVYTYFIGTPYARAIKN
jgi:hypothetical protein